MKSKISSKKIVKPLTPAQIRSCRVASVVQISILGALLIFMTLDTLCGWKSPLYISLLIFGASFVVKKVLEKYILPKVLAKGVPKDDRISQLYK